LDVTEVAVVVPLIEFKTCVKLNIGGITKVSELAFVLETTTLVGLVTIPLVRLL
jgi:hypothetical protein